MAHRERKKLLGFFGMGSSKTPSQIRSRSMPLDARSELSDLPSSSHHLDSVPVQARRSSERQSPRRIPARRRSEPLHRRPPISLEILSGILRCIDAGICLASGIAALALTRPDLPQTPSYYLALTLLGTVIVANTLSVVGVYRLNLLKQGGMPLDRMALGWLAAAIVVGIVAAFGNGGLVGSQGWLLLWFVSGGCLLLVTRALLAVRLDQWRQNGRLCQRVAVFGSGSTAQGLLHRLSQGHAAAMDHVVVGVYGNMAGTGGGERLVQILCGDLEDLLGAIRCQTVDAVIVAPSLREGRADAVIQLLRQAAVDIYAYPDLREIAAAMPGLETMGGIPLLSIDRRPLANWRGIAKAVEDRVFAAITLILIAPVLVLIAVLIRLDSPGPVLFRQKRYGLNNQLIEVLKFRTMRQDMCDQTASQLTRRNDPRVTRIGRFLRRTSLDELPQFINVLLGEMSVVGPRPHATAAKAAGLLYQDAVPNYDCRHRMKPGITGLAQVSGWRGETETLEQIRKRVEHDIYYIENWSLLLDAQIILRTVVGGFTGRQAF